MKEKRPEPAHFTDAERAQRILEDLKRTRPPRRSYRALTAIFMLIVLAAIVLAIFFNRKSLGLAWHHLTHPGELQTEPAPLPDNDTF